MQGQGAAGEQQEQGAARAAASGPAAVYHELAAGATAATQLLCGAREVGAPHEQEQE